MSAPYYNLDNPVQQVITNTITKFSIVSVTINPYSSADIIVKLLTADDVQVSTARYIMQGQDYLDWNNNDDYLIVWIKNQIVKSYPV